MEISLFIGLTGYLLLYLFTIIITIIIVIINIEVEEEEDDPSLPSGCIFDFRHYRLIYNNNINDNICGDAYDCICPYEHPPLGKNDLN